MSQEEKPLSELETKIAKAYRINESVENEQREIEVRLNKIEGKIELLQAGSSLKFIKIASGLADIYPRLAPTSEWDNAAAHAVLEGAGGHVLGIDGKDIIYGKKDILNPHFIARGIENKF